MSWYYVGPDAKPVGPISLEDLQSRRGSGAVGPETYVIEAPAGSAPKEWRRYRDVFPPPAVLPPVPAAAGVPPASMGIPHPIFPSSLPPTPSPGGPVFTGTHPSAYRLPGGKSNGWCSWGFGLSLASLPLMLCAGLGVLVAVAALVASIIGLVQVGHHRDQHGRGLAVSGLVISLLSLLCAAALIVAIVSNSMHGTLQMTTEQTSNDSDTR